MLALRWAGNPLLLQMLVLLALVLLMRWVGGAVVVSHPVPGRSIADGATTTFLLFASLWVCLASSTMMTLLTNSGNDPSMLSTMRSCSLVERPIMK
jgi:hypothetical protein